MTSDIQLDDRTATTGGPAIENERVSVVVMSRDRRDELLTSLGRHRAEVIFVDNASTDGSVTAVREDFPQVDTVPLEYNAGAFARTIGARRAGSEFVAFADDDSWWAPGSLAAAVEIFDAEPDVAVVNARIHVGPENRLDPVCAAMAESPLPRPNGSPLPSLLGFVACAAVVRRSAFLAVGGFDEVVRFPGEEERVALDLAEAGWRMVYADALLVHHHPSPRRHSPDKRVAAVTRSGILTAVMRLSAPRVGRRAWSALRAGRAARRGLYAAARDLPRAIRARRVAGADVQRTVDLLAASS
ncbi:glycosyltransferase family 2 protein [Nakamurella sp. GG22]